MANAKREGRCRSVDEMQFITFFFVVTISVASINATNKIWMVFFTIFFMTILNDIKMEKNEGRIRNKTKSKL